MQHKEGALQITGLSAFGTQWDADLGSLTQNAPGHLFSDFPPIRLVPKAVNGDGAFSNGGDGGDDNVRQEFVCPVYKSSRRKGTMATDCSHSNFIVSIPLPAQVPLSQWILRSVALVAHHDEC